ncbi:unnamed protein product [Closterium sp. NIES-53]
MAASLLQYHSLPLPTPISLLLSPLPSASLPPHQEKFGPKGPNAANPNGGGRPPAGGGKGKGGGSAAGGDDGFDYHMGLSTRPPWYCRYVWCSALLCSALQGGIHISCIAASAPLGEIGEEQREGQQRRGMTGWTITWGCQPDPPWYCSLCKVSATSKETLESHSEGKKHRGKVRGATRAALEAAKGQQDASRAAEEAGNGAVVDSAVQSGADGAASGKANGASPVAANGAATGGQENGAKEEGKSGGEEEGEGGAEVQGGEEGKKRKKGEKGDKGTKRKKRTEGGDKEETARKEEEQEAVEARSKTKKMKKKKEKGEADAEPPEGGAGIPWKKLIRQQLKAVSAVWCGAVWCGTCTLLPKRWCGVTGGRYVLGSGGGSSFGSNSRQ